MLKPGDTVETISEYDGAIWKGVISHIATNVVPPHDVRVYSNNWYRNGVNDGDGWMEYHKCTKVERTKAMQLFNDLG